MSIAVTVKLANKSNGRTTTREVSLSGSSAKRVSETIEASQTNKLVAFTLDLSACQGLMITANQQITIKTNSAGSPVATITVSPTQPWVWTADMPYDLTNWLTSDVTALYVTTGGTETLLEIRALEDATP